jgi:hypothetical protein
MEKLLGKKQLQARLQAAGKGGCRLQIASYRLKGRLLFTAAVRP